MLILMKKKPYQYLVSCEHGEHRNDVCIHPPPPHPARSVKTIQWIAHNSCGICISSNHQKSMSFVFSPYIKGLVNCI